MAPIEERILVLSRAPQLAPALRQLAADRAIDLVRAPDAAAACEHLSHHRFTCAFIDLDALGESADAFLAAARSLQPHLRTVGFGRMAASRPAAQWAGSPLLSKPLRREQLESALAGRDPGKRSPPASPPRPRTPPTAAEAARLLDATQEELERRVSQLTTLYQIARAIGESRDWSEALDYFLATLRDYLGVDGAAILLWSREATVLAPRTVVGMTPGDIERAVRTLRGAYSVTRATSEIHTLECWGGGSPPGLVCNGHATHWRFTVLPLLYRRAPLGFLVLDKAYEGGLAFSAELFFLQTIQIVLGEEVANAVHLSRLTDLKNFNAAVLENVESGVVTANEAGAITFANRLARQTIGITAEASLGHLSFDTLFQFDAAPRETVTLASLFDAPADTAAFTGALRRPDGDPVPVAVRTSRIVDPSDSEALLVVAFEDLTVQRTLEEQARRTDRLRSLGELSAAIAHEIRNPLQGISLTLSNLQEHLAPGAEAYVRVMFAEIERLNSIVGGVLAFARPAPPTPVQTGLRGLCARVVDLAREPAMRRGVAIELDPIDADDGIECDEGQLVQVLLNLVLNAIEASPAGGRVRLHAALSDRMRGDERGRRGSFWRIAVEDEGLGVRDELRSKVFDPFFTTKPEGNGLGLAVSAKIVEEHRGFVHIDSRPSGGTTFTVELPRRFAGLVLQTQR